MAACYDNDVSDVTASQVYTEWQWLSTTVRLLPPPSWRLTGFNSCRATLGHKYELLTCRSSLCVRNKFFTKRAV